MTVGIQPAKRGQVPKTLEEVYEEVGLPRLKAANPGERRAAANNRRAMTMLKKKESDGKKRQDNGGRNVTPGQN